MELKGTVEQISRDIKSGKFLLTLAVESIPEGVDSLPEGILAITIKKHREKRSLSANAYYWQIVGKISAHLKTSNARTHNILLRRYGTLEEIDGSTVMIMIPDTEEAGNKALDAELYHLKPTSQSKMTERGLYRCYLLIKGSSAYDTAEMSRLIDGAVDEARDMGIETLPPEELERMMAAYEKHNAH